MKKEGQERRSDQHQLQSQIQTAPFVKSQDRVQKDVSDMSMSDFQPKRFALKYEPVPMIVLEYLVPSTGKLYHHKMKLRQLTGNSDPEEMLQYLEKRHPLYFLQRKLSKPQIKNLIKKIIFRVAQTQPKKAPTPAASSSKPGDQTDSGSKKDIFSQNKRSHLKELEKQALEKENKHGLSSLSGAPSFKAGGALPSISDDLPGIGADAKKKATKAAVKFNDQFDDDFSAGEDEDEDELESPNEAKNDDEEDEDGDFDANELLDLGDYQKKRLGMGGGLGRDKENPLPSLSTKLAPAEYKPTPLAAVSKVAPPAQRNVINGASAQVGADEAFDCSYDEEDDIESSAQEETKAANIDFSKVDYRKTDLNKCNDAEIKAHKAHMENDFQKNAVKKGDAGFEYDKRVDFKYNAEDAASNSWDESDDSQDQGVEIVAANKRNLSKPKGVGLANKPVEFGDLNDNDNDYFDDDFDDDFQ